MISMNERGRTPQEKSEMPFLDREMYYAVEQPILEEMLEINDETDMAGTFAIQYPRISAIDGGWERVGVVIVDDSATRPETALSSYRITILHYKDDSSQTENSTHVMNEKDSTAYTLVETTEGIRGYVNVMYADCAYIAQHEMNAIEHSMLVDELVNVYQWQFADQRKEA